jgi:RNA polymerase sigma-70 factor (ECF subfamily)
VAHHVQDTSAVTLVLTAQLAQYLDSPLEPGQDLEALLQDLVAKCQAAWPKVAIPTEAFLSHLAASLANRSHLPADLARIHVADLYLALGCARGLPAALAAFEEHYLSRVPRYLARTDSSRALADEVKQTLRDQLLVPRGDGVPRIATFTGQGPLGAWLRISAVRLARDLLAAESRRHAQTGQARPAHQVSGDIELDYIRERYRGPFEQAFKQALLRLSQQERNVLRMYFLDGLTTVALGRVYRVHATTVARWIDRARAEVLREVRRSLAQNANVPAAEVDSLFGLLQSRFDLSLERLLNKNMG